MKKRIFNDPIGPSKKRKRKGGRGTTRGITGIVTPKGGPG